MPIGWWKTCSFCCAGNGKRNDAPLDMVMKLPAQALAESYAKDLEPGRLLYFRDAWALRVSHDDALEGILMLGGSLAGKILEIGRGMVPGLAIVAPFGWFPMVESETPPSREAPMPIALAITSAGPVVTGVDTRSHFADEFLTFGMDGRGQDVRELHRVPRYTQWSAELCLDERPFQSLGTLFQIVGGESAR